MRACAVRAFPCGVREREMEKQRERAETVNVGRRARTLEAASEQCNEREITTRIARTPDIELITCYLYYQDFRFALSKRGCRRF